MQLQTQKRGKLSQLLQLMMPKMPNIETFLWRPLVGGVVG